MELFHAAAALLGEGPIWDHRHGALAWVDIEGRQVHVTSADGAGTRSYATPDQVGAVALREQGGLLLAVGAGFATLDLVGEQVEWLVERAGGEDPARVRMNDGGVDPQGRFWCGTKAYDDTPGAGAIYRLDGPGQATEVLRGATIANGLVWSLDGTTVYWIDTPTQRVDRFAYDAATGTLRDRATHVDATDLPGAPDGMTIDAAGNLWVAFWGGWCVRCFSGADGRLLEELPVPAEQVTSCAFGGPELDRLFVTTARTGLSDEQLAEQPNAGSVFVCEPGARGVPERLAKL